MISERYLWYEQENREKTLRNSVQNYLDDFVIYKQGWALLLYVPLRVGKKLTQKCRKHLTTCKVLPRSLQELYLDPPQA